MLTSVFTKAENSKIERQLRHLGFTKVNRNVLDCAQCLHCSVVTSNESLRPSKLANNREKKHSRRKGDDAHALSAKKTRYDQEATLPHCGFLPEKNSVV